MSEENVTPSETTSEATESAAGDNTESTETTGSKINDFGVTKDTTADAAKEALATETAKKAEAEKAKAATEAAKSSKKKYKIKVDKNEEEVEFDPSNEEDVKKHLQKSRAADKRFQEAADVRKAAMEFLDQLRSNPRKVLSDPNIGVDLKKFAEEILNEEIKEMEKSPEQREREKLQTELERLKKEAADRTEEAKKSEFARLQSEQERELTSEIVSALDVGGIPNHPRTVKAMAEMMIIALQNGIDLKPSDVAPIIKNNNMTEFKEMIQALSDDQLEDFMGKEILGRLSKKRVAKAKAVQTASAVKPTGSTNKTTSDTPTKRMTIKQFLKA